MNRREFCIGFGSWMIPGAARGIPRMDQDSSRAAELDPDPAGGYTIKPPRRFLFTDCRHIDPGDLGWRSPEGKSLPVAGPPGPPVEASADAGSVARGIRLVAQAAVKEGPIEGLPNKILHDDGRYIAWTLGIDYGSAQDLGSYSRGRARSITIHYGDSKDGYAWIWRKGSTVTPPAVSGIDGECFFIDPHGSAEERYKCLYHALVLTGQAELWKRYQRLHPRYRDTRLKREVMRCLYGMVSPDGLTWKHIPEPLMIHWGDTDNTVYFDEWLGKYVLYTRLYYMDRRMVARSESEDFRRWTPVEPVLWPRLEDPLSWDVYTNGRTCYPGLPEHHLLFPIFYRRLDQTSEVHMHSSVEGIRWDRVPGGPVLEPGPPGAWDGEFIWAGKNLVPLGKDRIAIPYVGYDYPHKYPRWPGVIKSRTGWATWPQGRLSALRADQEGQFETFMVKVTGTALRINCKVQRAGEIRVGLAGVTGRSVDNCDPITGDHTERTVTWKGEPQPKVDLNAGVTLRFRMRSADLFGFEWR